MALQQSKSTCTTPFMLSEKNGGHPVPCGKCLNCLKRRVSAWSFRLMQEFKNSANGYFLTLTYDTDSVPITKNGFMELNKRDLQLFFKRLRKAHNKSDRGLGQRIKYYAVGEYGTKSRRPHYHIIIFNVDLAVLLGEKYANAVGSVFKLDGKKEFVCKQWINQQTFKPIGHITIGQISEASVGYTMKYVSKPSQVPLHRNDDRQIEFSLMSKGIGISYLTKAMQLWHLNDLENRMYCNLAGGKKIAMPRYYKNKIYSEEQRKKAGGAMAMESVQEKWEHIQKVGLDNYKIEQHNYRLAIERKHKLNNRSTDHEKL